MEQIYANETEEFFLEKIKSGLLVKKKGKVFNTKTKRTYTRSKASKEKGIPHTISLYDANHKTRVRTLYVNRVLWMMENGTTVPEGHNIRKKDGKLIAVKSEVAFDRSIKRGRNRKVDESKSKHALMKFIKTMPTIKSMKEFCDKENINFRTFYRDVKLINSLESMKEEDKQLVEGMMKFYKKVKTSPNGTNFKDAYMLRKKYEKSPKRICEFAKEEGITQNFAHKVLYNKTKHITGYEENTDDSLPINEFYKNMKEQKLVKAEALREEYIKTPSKMYIFIRNNGHKYDFGKDTIRKILSGKIHKSGALAKKCAKVKNKFHSVVR